jgi:hypothetical protein
MLGDFIVEGTPYRVYSHKPRQYSLLHTYAIWSSLLLLDYKPVQHVAVLNTVGSCNIILSRTILWDHCCICGPSLTETSLRGGYLHAAGKKYHTLQTCTLGSK